jgi:hypothetical protein
LLLSTDNDFGVEGRETAFYRVSFAACSARGRNQNAMTKVLDRRALNRALLARQHLLRRADLSVPEALERLIALQAQSAQAPYFALWTRLEAFAPQDLSGAAGGFRPGARHADARHAARAAAADFAAIRPLIQRGLDRFLTEGSVHGRALAGLDQAEITAAARELLRRGR